jgi:hypothetical protein
MNAGRDQLRRAGIGLADQVVSALSNAANIVLAALLLDPDRGAGAVMLAVTGGLRGREREPGVHRRCPARPGTPPRWR